MMITAQVRKTIFVGLIFVLFFFSFGISNVKAAGSCTATVNPNTVQTSTNSDFIFSVTNTGSNPILYIKITSPSANLLIQGSNLSGWERGSNSQSVEFYGGSIVAGSTLEIPVSILSGSNETSSENWTIEINETLSSSGTSTCTGSLGTAISGVRDVTSPQITGDIVVSDIVDNSARISWTTDESSNSKVNYGLDEEYSLNKSDSSTTTSHSITLTGLTANTKYYFEVISADVSGNEVRDSQNEFTTAMTGVNVGTTTVVTINTVTTTIINNSSQTSTPTPTPTPKPLIDTVLPRINVETNFSKPFTESPMIIGKATDGGDINVGVKIVEYSTDGGKNWLPVDNIKNPGEKSTSFDFTPTIYEDGNYKIKVRAMDSTGNKGYSQNYVLVIDRLPPQVGGSLFSLGPMILKPNKNGNVYSMTGMDIKVMLSAVGGPTTMDLFYNTDKFSLIKNEESGLWGGKIRFRNEGNFKLKVKSIDGAKNETERNLSSIVVLPSGKVIDYDKKPIVGAIIKTYIYEDSMKKFVLWDAKSYSQENPQESDENGEYRLILPAGKYYLELTASGKRKLRTEIFEVDEATPVNQNFEMNNAGFWLAWLAKTTTISNNKLENDEIKKNELIGKLFPDFNLGDKNNEFSDTSILGKPTVLSFLSTWEPQSSDQLLTLDKLKSENEEINVIPVITQESLSKTEVFKKIGGYNLNIQADPDGILVVPLNLEFLPTHVLVDRKGIIKDVIVGYLDKENLLTKLLN